MSSFQQSYLAKWEQIPEFSSWLSRYKDDEFTAFCKACNAKLQSRLASIKQHANTEKHKSNLIKYKGQSKVSITRFTYLVQGVLIYFNSKLIILVLFPK